MNWPQTPLGQVGRMIGGGTPSKKNKRFWNGGTIPWVSPKDMGSRELFTAEDHITEAAVSGSATQIVPAGSVLVVVRSGVLVRRFPVAIARVPVALNQDMKALLPMEGLLPEFLAYGLEAKSGDVLRSCVKRGATVHSVDIGKFKKLRLPAPAPSEQRRIVEILDQADALRKLRAEADAKAERILPALFIKMFGDPASNPMDWPSMSFQSLLARKPRNGTSPSTGGNVPGRVLTLNAITGSRFNEAAAKHALFASPLSDEKLVDEDDFLLCRGNGNIDLVGRGKFPTRSMPDTVFPDTIIAARIDPDKLDRGYLEYLWQLPSFRARIRAIARTTSGIHKVNQRGIGNLNVPTPPIEQQRSFGSHARAFAEMRRGGSDTALGKLFSLLLHRAFDGRLTQSWREEHTNELLQEMEQQARTIPVEAQCS